MTMLFNKTYTLIDRKLILYDVISEEDANDKLRQLIDLHDFTDVEVSYIRNKKTYYLVLKSESISDVQRVVDSILGEGRYILSIVDDQLFLEENDVNRTFRRKRSGDLSLKLFHTTLFASSFSIMCALIHVLFFVKSVSFHVIKTDLSYCVLFTTSCCTLVIIHHFVRRRDEIKEKSS